MPDKRFEFRNILPEEAGEAADIEQICFPPNEACARDVMIRRVLNEADMFLVAYDTVEGKIAGYLNGIATDEEKFSDDFLSGDVPHDPNGKNVMLAGLEVRPEYRRQGIAGELVVRFREMERARGRKRLILTCLEEKVAMYQRMGFRDLGLSASVWGGEEWHEMDMPCNV